MVRQSRWHVLCGRSAPLMFARRPKGFEARRRASKRGKQLRADRKVYAQVDLRDGKVSRLSHLGGDIHRHHIIYRSLGGKTTVENVITVTDAEHASIHAGKLKLSGNAHVRGGVEVRNEQGELIECV